MEVNIENSLCRNIYFDDFILVANKWIRQTGQVFTRLCGKLENSNDDFPEI